MAERERATDRGSGDALDRIAFEDAFVAITDGILLSDQDGHVVSANPAAYRVLGEDRLVGREFESLPQVSAATRVQKTESHLVRRTSLPREDRIAVLEMVSTILPGGRAMHTVRDVTAQAELLRLKEDFLLQVAHELRTPIAALSASLDLVLEDALSMPREELSAMITTLRRSALRLEHLVENLLDAGSIEAGTFQVRAIPTSLRQSLQEALGFVRPLIEMKRQQLVTDFAPRSEGVLADPRRTAQVFSNLLANATRYAPERSSITLTAEVVDGFVRVTITDEGPGIPEDERPQLFQRFFRSRSARDQAGGLGLGLAICRAIVHAQGGDIGVQCPPGGGTSVHFTVPKARQLAQEADR